MDSITNIEDVFNKYKENSFLKECLESENIVYYNKKNVVLGYSEDRNKRDQIIILSENVANVMANHSSSLVNVKTIIFLKDGPAPKSNINTYIDKFYIDFVFHKANFLKGKNFTLQGLQYIVNNFEKFDDKENLFKILKSQAIAMKNFRSEVIAKSNYKIIEFMIFHKLFNLEELNSLLECDIDQTTKISVLDDIKNFDSEEKEKYSNSVIRKEELVYGIIEHSLKDLKDDFVCSKKDNKIFISKYKGNDSSVVIPGSVDGITEFVFKSFKLADNVDTIIFDEGITKVFIDESVSCLFTKSKCLKNIKLPSTLTYIDSEIFSSIPYETTVDISRVKDSNFKYIDEHYLCYKNRLLFIKDRTNIKEIVLPEEVTEVKEFSFKKCKNLTKITLHKNLIRFDGFNFSKSKKIKSIEIPNCVTEIPCDAFKDCDRLAEINFNNVTSIGNDAFKNCIGLIEVVVPEPINYIDVGAFSQCTNLKIIKFPSSLKKIGPAIFESTGHISVYVPEEVEEMYNTFFRCYSFKIFTPKPKVEHEWHKVYKDNIEWI
ncbi:MAG: leucine-rich repeat domain-containing protein [bacterium]